MVEQMQRRKKRYRATNINEKYINVRGNHRKCLRAVFHARQGLEKLHGTPGLACTVERISDYVMFFYGLGTKHKNI